MKVPTIIFHQLKKKKGLQSDSKAVSERSILPLNKLNIDQ